MKKYLPLLACSLLLACSESPSSSETPNGQMFVGIWVNPVKPAQQNSGFAIDDRILIEKKADDVFSVSVLACGVFTEMKFDPKTNLLCTQDTDRACFRLENANTLTIGSENGLLTYQRTK